ncbi:putative inositol monophosphatase 3 [Argiope bruennichi]|uniref:putative inositol monophosphatase 3 n=1 Tax=Argiope bruennichi TaxID=94029 RepID=UPI0024942E0D|nr:putative inositol monophosphatase 3 [Argiope bruennichi]
MFVVRTKVIVILISCAISILLISSYYKNGIIRVKTCKKCLLKSDENSNNLEAITESVYDENLHYYYSYEKENMIYERDRSVTTEVEGDLQNYKIKNEIEYVDFMNSSEKIDLKQKNPNIINLKQLLSVCIKAAKAGGMQLLSVRRNFDLKKIWKMKPANSSDNPIHVGRTLSHQAMTYTLKKYFPNLQLVSRKLNEYDIDPYDEDFQPQNASDSHLVPTKNVLVWIDALEPEYEYQQNYLEYVTTAVCVAVKGKPVIGVIHQPFENFTKWGWVGHGESTDTYPVASEPVDVSEPISIIVPTRRAAFVKMKARMALGVHFHLFAVNGAGYSFIQVAEDKIDGYFHAFDIKKWKICAGDAIIKAAYGRMTTLDDKEIDYGDPNHFLSKRGFKASIEDLDLFEDFDSLEAIDFNS